MHHRMAWLVAWGLLLKAPGQAAQASEDGGAAAATGLEGKRWAWHSFTALDGGGLVPTDPTRYWVEFLPDGKLALQSDCNRGFGTWTKTGRVVQLNPLGTTLMACADGSLDGRFLELLRTTSRVAPDGATLLLSGPMGVLRLAPVPLPVHVRLTETAWTLVAVEDEAGATALPPGHYLVEFRPDGALQWKAECHQGGGRWEVQGRLLWLRAEGAASSAACVPATPGPDFARLLHMTGRVSLAGTELVLEEASRRLRLRAAPSLF